MPENCSTAHRGTRTRVTVLELEELPTGDWRATQTGTDHVGRGDTAAAAAAAYCQRIAGESDTGPEQG